MQATLGCVVGRAWLTMLLGGETATGVETRDDSLQLRGKRILPAGGAQRQAASDPSGQEAEYTGSNPLTGK